MEPGLGPEQQLLEDRLWAQRGDRTTARLRGTGKGQSQIRTGARHGAHIPAEAGANPGLVSVDLGDGRAGVPQSPASCLLWESGSGRGNPFSWRSCTPDRSLNRTPNSWLGRPRHPGWPRTFWVLASQERCQSWADWTCAPHLSGTPTPLPTLTEEQWGKTCTEAASGHPRSPPQGE